MKRDLKFRAWDKALNKMSLKPFSFGHVLSFQSEKGTHIKSLCQDHEVMQFTGLKDYNGTEIYEGDILKNRYDSDDYIGPLEVKFHSGAFMVWGGKPTGYRGQQFQHYPQNFEVMGNLYEHPHLLDVSSVSEKLK